MFSKTLFLREDDTPYCLFFNPLKDNTEFERPWRKAFGNIFGKVRMLGAQYCSFLHDDFYIIKDRNHNIAILVITLITDTKDNL